MSAGGSRQLRRYRIARRDGMDRAAAAEHAGIDVIEAKFIDADDAKNPPPPEAYDLLEPPMGDDHMQTIEHNPDTGEIYDEPQRAADGGRLTPAANSLGDFLKLIESGQFDADVHHELQEMAADMQNDLLAGAGKSKAKLQITVEVELETTGSGPLFYLRGSHKIVRPPQKRQRSVAWTTEDNRFTPNMPRQGALFGEMRDVNAGTRRHRDA